MANTRTEIFRRRVHGNVSQAVVMASPGATIGEIVRRMGDEKAGAAVVVDEGKKPLGIVTEQDIVRRVAWRVDQATPVDQVMSQPVLTIGAESYLFQAVAFMRRRGFRSMPVVGARGKLRGVLALHDALAHLSDANMELIEGLTHEGTAEGLKQVKDAQVTLAESLFDDGVPAPEVQSVLSDINADIHRRATARAIAELEAEGKGAPPAPFALLIFGSGGRGENFLTPDQDNGFVIADHHESEAARIDAWFALLAERLTVMLDRIGFPLCKGKVMATSPIWRRSLSGWKAELDRWVTARKEEMLLNAAIFADMRSAYGERALARQLREHFVTQAKRRKDFIRDLFMATADHAVALGWFGRLRIEKDRSDRPGMINLKLRGTLPLVQSVRVMALKMGLVEPATITRLEGLMEQGRIHRQDYDYLVAGFSFITGLLLRQQIRDYRQQREPDDFIAEASLSKREKEHLVGYFRAIENVRGSIRSEMGG